MTFSFIHFLRRTFLLAAFCWCASGCDRAPDATQTKTPQNIATKTATAETEIFEKLTDFRVSGQTAEIVAAAPDGNTLVTTDSTGKQLEFIDVRDAARPRSAGLVKVAGEPTSVAISYDNRWILSCVHGKPNHLLVLNSKRAVVRKIPLPGQPDCVAISPDNRFAAIAIENERLDLDKPMPQKPEGSLAILEMKGEPATWKLRLVDMRVVAMRFPADPEPEYISINARNQAAVTLQENNGVIVIDLASASITRAWSAGKTSHMADLHNDKKVDFADTLVAPREPDSIAWTPEGNLLTANEGDYDSELKSGEFSGGRNATLFSPQGRVLLDLNDIESAAAQNDSYADKRSEKKGAEPEGVAIGRFRLANEERTFAFIGCERAKGVALYDISNEAAPQLVQFLKTGKNPEGVVALPARSLFVSANEGDGTLSIFRLKNAKK